MPAIRRGALRGRTGGAEAALIYPPLSRGKLAAITFVFLWFFIGGIAHFAATALEQSIVPPYVPWPHATVLVSGVFELLGAGGLLYPPARRAAGIGLFALTLAVTPANVFMLQHADRFHVPHWALVARLPLQAVLLALIAYCSGFASARTHG